MMKKGRLGAVASVATLIFYKKNAGPQKKRMTIRALNQNEKAQKNLHKVYYNNVK